MLGLLYHHASRLDASNRDVTESHGCQIFCSVMHFHSYVVPQTEKGDIAIFRTISYQVAEGYRAIMVDMRNIKITAQMLSQIAEIEASKGTWDASTHMRAEQLKALRKVSTIESVGSSNRIERNKLWREAAK